MKRCFYSVLIALLSLPAIAQGEQSQAYVVLDKVADNMRRARGIEAEFEAKVYNNGRMEGEANGNIKMRGDKFRVETPEMVAWFDGKTQWTYMANTSEVNISMPTTEELQSINPYTFLYTHKKIFNSRMGAVESFRGRAVLEVVLTSKKPNRDIESIVLYVEKDTYRPLYILLRQQNGAKSRSEIFINTYRTKQHYADSEFAFDRSRYPDAEIIDLR